MRAAAVGTFLAVAWAASDLRAQPVNDNFPGTTLSGTPVSVIGSNVGATAQSGEPNPSGVSGSGSVWWSWTAPSTGTVTVSTSGSTFDTTLGIYAGSDVTALATLAQNDDSGGITSRATFGATAGTVYRIQVNGFHGAAGAIMLNISNPAGVAWVSPPPSSVVPGEAFTVSWTVWGGSPSPTKVEWDPINPPTLFFSPFQSGGPGTYSQTLTAPSAPGTWYYRATASMDWNLLETDVIPVTVVSSGPPVNDAFPGIELTSTPTLGSNIGATAEPWEPHPAGGSGTHSVWWSWTATSTGYFVVTTWHSGFDTALGVYTGSAAPLTPVAENNDSASQTSEITFLANAGTTYRIQVNGFAQDAGVIYLGIGQLNSPPYGGTGSPAGGDGGGGSVAGQVLVASVASAAGCGCVGLELMIPFVLLWLGRRVRSAIALR